MTLTQANLEEVLLHLLHTRNAMRRLMATSSDWVAKEMVEAEFLSLRDQIREFARCQLGLRRPRRTPTTRG